jgi:hypothetical protein
MERWICTLRPHRSKEVLVRPDRSHSSGSSDLLRLEEDGKLRRSKVNRARTGRYRPLPAHFISSIRTTPPSNYAPCKHNDRACHVIKQSITLLTWLKTKLIEQSMNTLGSYQGSQARFGSLGSP